MRYIIRDEVADRRMRIHICGQHAMTALQADLLVSYLAGLKQVRQVKVYERLGDLVIRYSCPRADMLKRIDDLEWKQLLDSDHMPENSVRSINQHYRDQVTDRILRRVMSKIFLPLPVRSAMTVAQSVRYFARACRSLLNRKIDTSLLDAATLGVSFVRSNYDGAGGVVFLLDLGQILEDWIRKNKVESLSETMSLNLDYVWRYQESGEERVPADQINRGDLVIVSEGEMIPYDGLIRSGAGSVIMDSFSGNALPQSRQEGDPVYAGTTLEEGEFVMEVTEEDHLSRYDKLVELVDASQNLKPEYEGRAIDRANHLVPYMIGGSAMTYLLTRNRDRAFSFLTVDFSYALKLALPMAVLHARKKAMDEKMLVKGGRFMEHMAEADYIVFDKTGTLTKAELVLKHVHSCGCYSEEQLLALAACLEEHVSNGVAKAVVAAARDRGIDHEEVHAEIENVYAHGVATYINKNRILFGSYHFIFEDEGCPIPEGLLEELQGSEHARQHHMYLAINQRLEGIFCVEDVLRDEVVEVIQALRESGFKKVILLSGDTELSAKEAAAEAMIGTYYAEKMPEEKAEYISQLQSEGHKVVMVGDGVNDSLALSMADVGIAVSAGATVSKELADVIVKNDDLFSIVKLRHISQQLMKKMKQGYDSITLFNGALIALGAAGLVLPSTISTASNASTLAITLGMTQPLI